MKFSCDSCGKKYATADDPAPGRVYKIKCKACGHLIVVKASAGGAPAVPHHEPPAAPPPAPPEIPLEIGTPEREAPPPWPNETRARSAEPTAHVAMPAPEEQTPQPGDGGYVDLFSDTGAPPLPGPGGSVDPFAAAPSPLDDRFGAGASSLPDPFAPVREVKAHETVTPEPPPMPKVPVIPKPAQQRSIVPIALMGGGVALLLAIVGFVVVSRGGSQAPAPARPAVARAAGAVPVVPPEPAPPAPATPAAPEAQPPPAPAADAAADARRAAEEARRRELAEAAARSERARADRAERDRLAREEKARAAAEARDRADRAKAERAERDRAAREAKARAAAEAKERARLAVEDRARAAAEAKERARLAAEEKAARLAREREERVAREAAAREERERDDRVAAAMEAEEAQSLTQSQIEGVLRASKPSFDGCMRAAAGSEVKLDGRRIMLRLNIQPSGAVTYPTIDDVVVNGADLGTCLKGAARSMLFPKFAGDTMHIEVPIALR